jgi:hypothetical protein
MARGFDSKAVSDQQEEAERARERNRSEAKPGPSPRRRTLELARLDLVRRLEAAPAAHRPALQSALADLDELIKRA